MEMVRWQNCRIWGRRDEMNRRIAENAEAVREVAGRLSRIAKNFLGDLDPAVAEEQLPELEGLLEDVYYEGRSDGYVKGYGNARREDATRLRELMDLP